MPESAAMIPYDAETQELIRRELEQEQGFRLVPVRVGVEHRARVFSYPDGSTKRQLLGVILKSSIVRGRWASGNPAPLCTSRDGAVGIDAEGREHDCRRCPHDRWGSAIRFDEAGHPVPGRGKACKEMRRLLILEEGAEMPILLNVPPTSLKAFDTYASMLRIVQKLPLIAVKTAIRLEGAEAGGKPFARMAFEQAGRIAADELRYLIGFRNAIQQNIDLAEISLEDAEEDASQAGGADLIDIPF